MEGPRLESYWNILLLCKNILSYKYNYELISKNNLQASCIHKYWVLSFIKCPQNDKYNLIFKILKNNRNCFLEYM